MALEGVADIIEIVARFIGRLFTEVLIEFLCKGMGYLICRKFNEDIDPDGFMVLIVGLSFWVIVIVSAILIYDTLVQQIAPV
ncbi:hypothetical protein [Alteromonas oceani]|uniref:hypothetical protein n=1 Tax=Alteromonas oceani TaxID=2071609 RepID=UPI000F46A870|nr:hypothetical protein [Alteromonas oceani]